MQKIKIKNINIHGFRGVKKQVVIPLSEKSVLFYGDNGTGKSSIVDAIEWYYYDKIKHLAGEEVDKSVLRHISLTEPEDASIELNYSLSKIDSTKSLSFKKDKISTKLSPDSTDLNEYKKVSEKENLILRHQYLHDFILQPKGEKLKYLSDIIGFSEVIKVKDVIKKSFNSIKTEIKSQGFESQIQSQQKILIEQIGANIFSEEQLFLKLNELITPLNLEVSINSLKDIDTVIEKIKKYSNKKAITELTFLQKCISVLNLLKNEISLIGNEYTAYYTEFEKLFNDVESIKQTLLAELLNKGKDVLSKKIFLQDNCPLCLLPKGQSDLLRDIEKRLLDIEKSSQKLKAFEKSKQSIKLIVDERIRRVDILLAEILLMEDANSIIKSSIEGIKEKLLSYQTEIGVKVLNGKLIKRATEIKLSDNDFNSISAIEERAAKIEADLKKDISSSILVKMEFAKKAFYEIQKLNTNKGILENQKASIEVIYSEFVKKQKEGLENFINTFSSVINEYYQYMNPGEPFEDLKIIPIEDDEELKGITVQFKFNGTELSAPQKYFSESHLNCYGLSFFLASVRAFNPTNKFFVLDDVISSFDTTHRKRFADLLFEKFSDYQIILFTHEMEWFTYVKKIAKNKSWHIHQIKWSDADGVHLEQSPSELRELIEYQITNGHVEQLGNSIRIYLESILKDICFNLEVKTNFKYNDLNENRMSDELLNELKSKINDKSKELKLKVPTIDRIASSNVLGNLLSHDNPITPKIGDLKAFWADIIELETIFYCQDESCKKPISKKYFDNVEGKIRCGCGKTKYDWKN